MLSALLVQVKPLPHASLGNHAGFWFAPSPTQPFYHCADFTLTLKPFPHFLRKADGTVNHHLLVPSWLPQPVHPSTHERRHLRDLFLPTPTVSLDADGGEKWEPTAASVQELASKLRDQRPVLRVFVISTKKRIHKYAVIRNQVRTRLVAALRRALHQIQCEEPADGKATLDAIQILCNVVVIIGNPAAHQRSMDDLVVKMRAAISRITQLPSARGKAPSITPRSRPPLFRSRQTSKNFTAKRTALPKSSI